MPRFPILQYDPPVHRERICELLHGYFLKPSHLHYDFLHCLQQTPPNTYFVTIFAWLQLLINLIHLFNAKRATQRGQASISFSLYMHCHSCLTPCLTHCQFQRINFLRVSASVYRYQKHNTCP